MHYLWHMIISKYIHAFVLISDIFMNVPKGLHCIYRTEQNWFIIPIGYKAHGNMINASCMMIYILMLNCMSKTIKGQRPNEILSNCVFYIWFLFQVKGRSYFQSHDDIENPDSRESLTGWPTQRWDFYFWISSQLSWTSSTNIARYLLDYP